MPARPYRQERYQQERYQQERYQRGRHPQQRCAEARHQRRWRAAVAASAVLLLCACSESDGGGPSSDDRTSAVVAGNGAAGESALPSTPVSGGAGGSAAGSGGMSAAAAGSGSGAGGGSGFSQSGVCGQRGESPVTVDSFAGYEEFYLIGDDGFGVDICVVRFDVARVGAAPDGCQDCLWSHEVEYGNPQVLTDVSDVCAHSQLGMDAAKIDEIDGSRAAYGFVREYAGHVSVLMKYDDATGTWGPNGNANWSAETGRLRFDRRDGICEYQ